MMIKGISINRKRVIGIFRDLIGINSPSFEEEALGRHIREILKRAGFSVTWQKYERSFNLIASKKGSMKRSRPLLLSAHMDTIEPTEGIRYEIKDGVISSTGGTVLGADDKSAIAQIIEAVTVLQECGLPHGDLEIVFTSAEEKGLFGAKHLDYGKIRSRHAIVLDSGGPVGKIVVAAPTHLTYEMKIIGKSAHAGIEPEKGISAIKVASEIISAVPDGRIDEVTTANIGMISGGTATNVVPREVVINGEVRSHSSAMLKKVKDDIFGTARNIAKRSKAAVHINSHVEYQAFRIRKKEPFLEFMDRVFVAEGITPEYTVTGGGSDANIFNQHGIVTLNLSTGMQKVHSHDEYIYVDDLVNGAYIVASAAREFAGFKY